MNASGKTRQRQYLNRREGSAKQTRQVSYLRSRQHGRVDPTLQHRAKASVFGRIGIGSAWARQPLSSPRRRHRRRSAGQPAPPPPPPPARCPPRPRRPAGSTAGGHARSSPAAPALAPRRRRTAAGGPRAARDRRAPTAFPPHGTQSQLLRRLTQENQADMLMRESTGTAVPVASPPAASPSAAGGVASCTKVGLVRLERRCLSLSPRTEEMMQPFLNLPTCHLFGCARPSFMQAAVLSGAVEGRNIG